MPCLKMYWIAYRMLNSAFVVNASCLSKVYNHYHYQHFSSYSDVIYTNISLIPQTALVFLEIDAQLYECIKSCKCYMQTKLLYVLDVLYDLIMRGVLLREIKSDRHDKSDKRVEYHYFRMLLQDTDVPE